MTNKFTTSIIYQSQSQNFFIPTRTLYVHNNSFIHYGDLYSTSSTLPLRSAPDPCTAKKKSFETRVECARMCQKEFWGAIFATTEAHSTQMDQPPRMHGPGLWMYDNKCVVLDVIEEKSDQHHKPKSVAGTCLFAKIMKVSFVFRVILF